MTWEEAQEFLARESQRMKCVPGALLPVLEQGQARVLVEWCLEQERRLEAPLEEALSSRLQTGAWPRLDEVMRFLLDWRLMSAVALADSLKTLRVPCPDTPAQVLRWLCLEGWPSRRWHAWLHFAGRLLAGPHLRDPFDPPEWLE